MFGFETQECKINGIVWQKTVDTFDDTFDGLFVSLQGGRIVSREAVTAFGLITGDRNDIHIDDEAAVKAGFEGAVAHGAFGLLLAMCHVGEQKSLTSATMKFRSPLLVGSLFSIRQRGLDLTILNQSGAIATELCLRNTRVQNSDAVPNELLVGFISMMLGMHFPGPGSVWVDGYFDFIGDVKVGKEVSIVAKLAEITKRLGLPDRGKVLIEVSQSGELLMTATTTLILPASLTREYE